MSGLAELSQRHARLQEISGIMTAMKNLSLVETHKLAKFLLHQQAMRANIEAAAADFIQFHPASCVAPTQQPTPMLVLIGSERGFCGNFNERLLQALDALPASYAQATLLVLGHRLCRRMAGHPRVKAALDGATVTEEVPAVLERLLDAVHALQSGSALTHTSFACLAHHAHAEPSLTQLLPMAWLPTGRQHPDPPQLQLGPALFYQQLLDQFLLAALLGELYQSLAAESRLRLAHMQQAIERLEQTMAQLALRRNSLRQERIVEEIEVLLSSEMAFSQNQQTRSAGLPAPYRRVLRGQRA